jgi:hypothetical protein
MSTATTGRSSEYKVRDDLISHGWEFVMRAAASKGPGDLLMGHPLTPDTAKHTGAFHG